MNKCKVPQVSYKTVALAHIEEKLDKVYQIIFQQMETMGIAQEGNKNKYERSGNNNN